MRMSTVLYSNVPFCTVPYYSVLYHSVLYCTILYTVTSLADTHLLIKLFMLGPLDKSFLVVVVVVVGGWHCNYSFKLQGSRVDIESLPLVELDRRHRESNSWTPILTINQLFQFDVTNHSIK